MQIEKYHPKIKPLKSLTGVFEIINDYQSDTYRTLYALKIDDAIYVLYAFKKKSKTGIKTTIGRKEDETSHQGKVGRGPSCFKEKTCLEI